MDRWGRRHSLTRRTTKRGVCITVAMLGAVIVTVFLAYAAFANGGHQATLQQVVFVFRHGDRTPTETYPKDPYVNYEWPGGWGALTKKGMLQTYNVGQWIRKEYGSVIGKTYRGTEALIESSYADRCIMSAQALLAGLYLPDAEDLFVSDLNWRPVPVHAIPRNLDKVIVVKAPCPRLEAALKEAYANESARNNNEMNNYYKEISAHTGQNMTTITDIEFLYNTLEIEDIFGLRLPEWTKSFYNQQMREIAARSLAIFTSNTLQRRLRGGPLLKDILGHMRDGKSGADRRQAYLYSAHDITLVNLLRAMGFTDELFKPDYAATLIFEVHSIPDHQDREVKVLYLNNSETAVAHPMHVPRCGSPCLLENLMSIWKDVIPANWDKECALE